MTITDDLTASPSTLVAILWAAHRAGDRPLERRVRRRLVDEYGMRVSIARTPSDHPDAMESGTRSVPHRVP